MRKRALRILLLAGTAITFPALAHADPGTLIGLAVTGATAIAGATLSGTTLALVTAAISLVGSLAAFALNASRSVRGQSSSRTREWDAHPRRRFVLGEVPVEGSVVAHFVDGSYYYVAALLNSDPSDSLSKVKIGDIDFPLEADATYDVYDMLKGSVAIVGDGEPADPWDKDSSGEAIVTVWLARGDQTQPPQDWLDALGDKIASSDTWPSGDVKATIVFLKFFYAEENYAQVRWGLGKPPPMRFYIKGCKVYDPRLDSTSGVTGGSGSHRPGDESTWAWSSNPALCTLHVLRHKYGLGVADERILIQQWADAADACEVQDGGVSEVQLHEEDWTGSAPASLPAAPVSGTWYYNRGSVTVGVKDDPALAGTHSLKLISTDGDGTVIESETARAGVYIDMTANSRSADETYSLRFDPAFAGTSTQAKWGWRVFQADKGSSGDNTDQANNFLPSDATNIVEVYDTELRTIDDGFTSDKTHDVTGHYVSMVVYGGEPNASDTEFRRITLYTTAQGGVTRYRCDGVLTVETDEWTLLDGPLDSMAGFLDTTSGKIGVRAGAWTAPSATLSQPVGEGFEYQGREDVGFDKVVPSFISRTRDYDATDGPAYVLRSGDRTHSLQLPFVREQEQAARLAKIFGRRAKLNRRLSLMVSGKEWGVRVGDRYTVTVTNFARANMTGIVEAVEPVLEPVKDGFRLRIRLTLREDEEATYTWASSDYTEPDATTPPPATSSAISAPTSVTAAQSDYVTSPGGSAIARLSITVANTASVVSHGGDVRVEVSENNGSTWLPLGIFAPETSLVVYRDPASVGLTYKARARNESDSLGNSAWVESGSVTIVAPVRNYSSDYSVDYA